MANWYVHYDDSHTRVERAGTNTKRDFNRAPDGEYYFDRQADALGAAIATVTGLLRNCLRTGRAVRAERLRQCKQRLEAELRDCNSNE